MSMLENTAKDAQALTEKFNSFLTRADELMPETADPELYGKLVDAVGEATENNEDIAAFTERVGKLGQGAVDLAKAVGLIA